MQRKVVAPLLVALTVCALVIMTGCNKTNSEPVIGAITAMPSDTTTPGGKIVLKVTATDEDGDPLTYKWKATTGSLSDTTVTVDSVVWTAPASAATCTLTLTVTDDSDGKDTAYKVVYARAWVHMEIGGSTADSTWLPNPGTVEIPFVLDHVIPAGAYIDSVQVTTRFEPEELALEQFDIWAVSPAGTEVLLYDGFNLTELNVDERLLNAVRDETANGIWKLKVTRTTTGIEGYGEDSDIDIYFRY